MKTVKNKAIALAYFMLVPGLALGMAGIPNEFGDDSKYDANSPAERDIGDYWEAQQWDTASSKPGADAGVAGYDFSDSSSSSDDSEDSSMPEAPVKPVTANPFGHTSVSTLTNEVQHFLRYTESQDTSGHKSDDDNYDSSNIEGIQHTIAREIQECVAHIDLLEKQIDKLKGFEAAQDPVKAFNDSRGWKLWKKKAKSLKDIQDDREVEEKQLDIAKQHLSLMMAYAAQLANIEIEAAQSNIALVDSLVKQVNDKKLTETQALGKYNEQQKRTGMFSMYYRFSSVKSSKDKSQKELKYWQGYKDSILKIVPEKTYKEMIAQNYQQTMKHGGFGVGVASPKIDVSPMPFMSKKKKPVEVEKISSPPSAPATRPTTPLIDTASHQMHKSSSVHDDLEHDTGTKLMKLTPLLSMLHQEVPVASSNFKARF